MLLVLSTTAKCSEKWKERREVVRRVEIHLKEVSKFKVKTGEGALFLKREWGFLPYKGTLCVGKGCPYSERELSMWTGGGMLCPEGSRFQKRVPQP